MTSKAADDKVKKSTKKSSDISPDVCVYVWEQAAEGSKEWAWLRVDLDAKQVPDQVAKGYVDNGQHAVVGKISIGAPEGPPNGWTQEIGNMVADALATPDVDPELAKGAEAKPAPKGKKRKKATGEEVASQRVLDKLGAREVPADDVSTMPRTPFISVSSNHFGTGETPMLARAAMIKAGASAAGPSIVYQLPEGARGASVRDSGEMIHFGPAGAAVPVCEFNGGKRKNIVAAKDKLVEVETVGESSQEPGEMIPPDPTLLTDADKARLANAVDDAAKKVAPARAAKNKARKQQAAQEVADRDLKPENAEEARVDPETGDTVVGAADADGVARPTQSDFLLFIGGNFYTKEVFISEAAVQGISRRMPSHRVPKDLIPGVSRVFVAAEGKRKADSDVNESEVFGYFIPSRIEYISLGNKKPQAEVIAALGLRPDTQVLAAVEGEPMRACGQRKDGGTYLVVDSADSPLHLLDKPAKYVGNHFRGMMRLAPAQVEAFAEGGEVATLVDEICMRCGATFKCAPDGHQRAERERRRVENGGGLKWSLDCGKCRKEVAAEKAKARRAIEMEAAGTAGPAHDAPLEGDDEEGDDALLGTD